MPTFEPEPRFLADYSQLTEEERAAFRRMRRRFVEDLKRDGHFRPGLRVKRVVTHPGVWEVTWAPDGRATFSYGLEVRPGEPHIIWRRVGKHEILDNL